jgi:carboxylesterase type B
MLFLLTFLWTGLLCTAHPLVLNNRTGVSYRGREVDGVEHFLGIHYGQDTSGEARFSPPRPYEPTAGTVIDASHDGAACPQPSVPLRGDPYSIVANVSENCLTLRIARPADRTEGTKLPVMVWIHGGMLTEISNFEWGN